MIDFLDNIYFLKDDIIDFILYPEFTGILLFIKVIFSAVSIILLIFIVFFLFKTSWFSRFYVEDFFETFSKKPFGAKETFRNFLNIKKRLESGRQEEYKLALIEADSLLDDVLGMSGYKGDNFAEKLKQVEQGDIKNINQVADAHKVRNNLVFDPDYNLDIDTAKRIINIYQEALRDLEAL